MELAKEVIFEILLRLPFEELIEKRLVGKQWNKIVKDNYLWYKKYCSEFGTVEIDNSKKWLELYVAQYRSNGYRRDNFKYNKITLKNTIKQGNIALLRQFKKKWVLADILEDVEDMPILRLVFRPQQENIRNYLIEVKPTVYNKLCCDAVMNKKYKLVAEILQLIDYYTDNGVADEIYMFIGKRGDNALALQIADENNINKIAYGAIAHKQWFFLSLITCSYSLDYNVILGYAIDYSDLEMINTVLDKGANEVEKLGDYLINFKPFTQPKVLQFESRQLKTVALVDTLNTLKIILFKTINLGYGGLDLLILAYSEVAELKPIAITLVKNYWKSIPAQQLLTVIMKLKYHPPDLAEILEEKKPKAIEDFMKFLIVFGYRQPGQSKTVTHTLEDLSITLNYALKYSLIDLTHVDSLINLASRECRYDVLPILRHFKVDPDNHRGLL